jgi:OPA family glycerol-3-phosphate transporter-like MFS transporter
MGMLIHAGYGWRQLFYFAAVVAGVVFLANLLFLRASRASLGFPEAAVNPLNVFHASRPGGGPADLRTLLLPLLTNPNFLIVCFLSFGTTIIRETFNTWTPTYLHSYLHYTEAAAASSSAVFPAVGIASVLIAGWTGDHLGPYGRSVVLFCGMLLTTIALALLAGLGPGLQSALPLVFLGSVGFGLLGPYSYLAGAMALDFGGSVAGATSSGIIDGVGYLGGVLAGDSVARLSVHYGWSGVFVVLALVSFLSSAAAAFLFFHQRRQLADAG